jgi:DNA segregation ATPase FtsK/SpoIIIE, S-DNA-T family
MTEPFSMDAPGELLERLRSLTADRARDEVRVPAEYRSRNRATEDPYQENRKRIADEYQARKASTEAEFTSTKQGITTQFKIDHGNGKKGYEDAQSAVTNRSEEADRACKKEYQEAHWEATTIFDASKDKPAQRLQELTNQLQAGSDELEEIRQEAVQILQRRLQWREFPQPLMPPPIANGNPFERFTAAVEIARDQLDSLQGQTVASLFEGAKPLGIFVLMTVVTVVPTWFTFGLDGWYWTAAVFVLTVALFSGLTVWCWRVAQRESVEAYEAIWRTILSAEGDRRLAIAAAKQECKRQTEQIAKKLEDELAVAKQKFVAITGETDSRKKKELQEVEQKYPPLLSETVSRRDRQLEEAEKTFGLRLNSIESDYETESVRLREEYQRKMAESEDRFQREWNALVRDWQSGMSRFQSELDELNGSCDLRFPDWNASDWGNWSAPTEIPRVIRFGHFEVDTSQIEGGIPQAEELTRDRTEFSLPAMLPFPDRSLLLLKASGEGCPRAVTAIQAVMLRMLTSLPPGKVRFTIIDPVGLGENFSAFMHLADYDEQLVSSRIWTNNSHIEQRLANLTEHMETVIQVYLRNEFETIQQYNEFAGEMAEPYRVLVIANFPANFTEEAGRRLRSVVASGARCGVFTLLSVDTKAQMPRGFRLGDLLPHAVSLRWREGRFVWEDRDFENLPLVLESPPDAERFTDVVRDVGSRVEDADRVEVPFECVVPEASDWWKGDTSSQLDVPLGRAGAMKLQYLSLGRGTSQHVLISGKTGSGKSTLLHALITNLALHYDPDQIEFYLVDFKKGVEFKAYATQRLPHARVIAIESEREFGLSVLEHLDAELRRRGDLFRNLGVQDLAGFRAAEPGVKLPRVLLVIDEFQELFVEDDRIAQSASLLLDRLVRQGRAFGIHVLLGSQTLAGAYSLPRATIGQMAVRIALQCSEADAHLILSEENTAARLLTRPGEAIYNDTNGLFEGNHPFQVVWLPDDQRETYLSRIQELAVERGSQFPPPIVFEGNVPADPSDNRLLGELLGADSWPDPVRAPKAWLGSAVAIKDPSVAEFARQGGSNLMLVGHREEAALGVLATSMISLAAQDLRATFHVLDGMRPDAPETGFYKRIAAATAQPVSISGVRKMPQVIAEIAAEVARREESGIDDDPPIYLVIHDLGRFRELRKDESDFGFSSMSDDKPPSPSKQFVKILQEGPAVGVHVLFWCDTYNNVARSLDRQVLHDVEMRVLFQMNATDSSNLIDSPAAGRLGVHRGILYKEGQGSQEKFRPYGLPSDDWLDWVKKQLAARASKAAATSSDRS